MKFLNFACFLLSALLSQSLLLGMKGKKYFPQKKNSHLQRKKSHGQEHEISDVSQDALCISSELCFKCEKQHHSIFHAISHKCMLCVVFFNKKGHGDDWRKKKPHFPLEKACLEGYFDCVQYLIEKNNYFKINTKRAQKLLVSSLKYASIVAFLFEKGVKPKSDNELSKLLFEAIQAGYSATALVLFEYGADINFVPELSTKQKYVPLIVLVAQQGFKDVLSIILKKLEKSKALDCIDECDYRGGTALCYAFENGDEEMVQMLKEAGALFSNNNKTVTITRSSSVFELLDKAFSKMTL